MLSLLARLLLVLATAAASAQSAASPAAPAQVSANRQTEAGSEERTDITALIKETQQTDNRNGKLGVFWWAPTEYFEQAAISSGASPGQARRSFAALQSYTLIIVAVGEIGFGNIDWLPEEKVRGNILLRDASGNIYKPLDKVSADAQGFADLMKPMMKNMLGPMGDGIHYLFFPSKDALGNSLANPRERSEFSVQVTDLMGPGKTNYTWRLPLSSLLPPKYCPVGKERVEANWKYCPWHGNKLDDPASAPALAK